MCVRTDRFSTSFRPFHHLHRAVSAPARGGPGDSEQRWSCAGAAAADSAPEQGWIGPPPRLGHPRTRRQLSLPTFSSPDSGSLRWRESYRSFGWFPADETHSGPGRQPGRDDQSSVTTIRISRHGAIRFQGRTLHAAWKSALCTSTMLVSMAGIAGRIRHGPPSRHRPQRRHHRRNHRPGYSTFGTDLGAAVYSCSSACLMRRIMRAATT